MLCRVERINPYLIVRDIKESLKFYVNILGFDEYVETQNLAIIEGDGHQIHLIKSQDAPTINRIWIGVDDIETLYDQFKKNDVIFIQEPSNFSWAYQMIIEDPDGNKLIFGSAPKPELPFVDAIK